MGVMPVKQLIISMSLPMMISMLVQALYNVVDSIFVSQIVGETATAGQDALTAVTLAFPMQNLMIALGSGTGVGINALLSRSLGEKNYKKSDLAANNGILLTFFNYLLFLLIGIFFIKAILSTHIQFKYINKLFLKCKRPNFFPFYLPKHICNFFMRTVIYIYIYDEYLYLGSFY